MIGIIVIIILFIVLGVILINGKGSFFIAGYNAKSEEELKEYDTVALCKFMGKIMFALSFSMLLFLLSDLYELNWLVIFSFGLFVSIVIFQLIYTKNWNRFKI